MSLAPLTMREARLLSLSTRTRLNLQDLEGTSGKGLMRGWATTSSSAPLPAS